MFDCLKMFYFRTRFQSEQKDSQTEGLENKFFNRLEWFNYYLVNYSSRIIR